MHEGIGERLKNARMKRQYTLEFVSATAGIPLVILGALEAEDYKFIGSRIYALRHGERYAHFLGILDASFREALERGWEIYALGEARTVFAPRHLRDAFGALYEKHSFILTASLAGLIIGVYIVYQFLFLVRGPDFAVFHPREEYLIVHEPFVDFWGNVANDVKLSINHRPMNIKDNGFRERLYLTEGVNRIEIEATNARGKSAYRETYVVYPVTSENNSGSIPLENGKLRALVRM